MDILFSLKVESEMSSVRNFAFLFFSSFFASKLNLLIPLCQQLRFQGFKITLIPRVPIRTHRNSTPYSNSRTGELRMTIASLIIDTVVLVDVEHSVCNKIWSFDSDKFDLSLFKFLIYLKAVSDSSSSSDS